VRHFDRIAISALYGDLAAHRAGSAIWFEEIHRDGNPRVVITYEHVPFFRSRSGEGNTFQVTLFILTGQIRLSWAHITTDSTDVPTVGLSPGVFCADVQEVDTPEPCNSTCGDGNRTGLEQCDDNNTEADDGCSPTCTVEAGYFCSVPVPGDADTCSPAVCGDKFRDAPEECDDQNTIAGDGCSSTCTVEDGFVCTRESENHTDTCIGTGSAASQAFGMELNGRFDLEKKQLLFVPSASELEYSVCKRDVVNFTLPDLPSPRATKMVLEDDNSVAVKLSQDFTFFGIKYRTIHVNPNGYVTFDGPDDERIGTPSLATHYDRVRISALFTDLAPHTSGTVFYETISDGTYSRFVLTYMGIAEFARPLSSSTFQIALFLNDGRIRLSWSSVDVNQAVVGISPSYQAKARSLYLDKAYLQVEQGELQTASDFYAGDFTWEAYYKLGESPADIPIFSNNPQGRELANQVRLEVNRTGHILVYLKSNGQILIDAGGATALPSLGWAHVALVVDQGASCHAALSTTSPSCTHVLLYINFIRHEEWRLDESTFIGGANFSSGQGLVIGGGPNRTQPLNLAAVRVHSRALKSSDLGSCRHSGPSAKVNSIILSVDLDGAIVDVGSGLEVKTVGPTSWFVDDAPSKCAQQPDMWMRDLSSCARCSNVCGNGRRETGENCDDGNTVAGDGCDDLCSIEPGYACRGSTIDDPDTCKLIKCGDSVADGYEECDDGNTVSGDGCSSECLVQLGYVCTPAVFDPQVDKRSKCSTVCGDARRVGNETCDDGNDASGDGCSHCSVEPGFLCLGGTEHVRDNCHPICGDGQRVNEACDDGNTVNGDGCSSSCVIEYGYSCYGGNASHADHCVFAVCGDGVVEGAEECDDYNRLGNDGCSSFCTIEPEQPSLSAEAQVSVNVFPMPQACRISNAAMHKTFEGQIYNLQHTVLTGDVETPQSVSISVKVTRGRMTLVPLIEYWQSINHTDAVIAALLRRETGILMDPQENKTTFTVLTGSAVNIDRFLRYFVYIEPDAEFAGIIQVDFEMVSGIRLGEDAVKCAEATIIRFVDVYDDPPMIMLSDELDSIGLVCVEGAVSCEVKGITVQDADCSLVVDGSCFLRLSVTATAGNLSIAGGREDERPSLPLMEGHAPGLNAALNTLHYIPPVKRTGSGVQTLYLQLNREVQPTTATPKELKSMAARATVKITVAAGDTPPMLRFTSGEAFHGSLIRVRGSKPFRMTNIVLEVPGMGESAMVMLRLEVQRGTLWLGTTEGIDFENGTAEGESRIQWRANASLMKTKYVSDVRYAWYDEDCQNLEPFQATITDLRHVPWTLNAMLELPDCKGFTLEWLGGLAELQEDSHAELRSISLRSHDQDLFLVIDIRHPAGIAGDCRLVFWDNPANTFVPGRECHMDGSVRDLNKILSNVTYRPPLDWSGDLELEVIARRVSMEAVIAGSGIDDNSYQVGTIRIPVRVVEVNDAPVVDIGQEVIAIKEDINAPAVLSPIFISDVDAGDHPLAFNFELLGSSGTLHMCSLQNVGWSEAPFVLDDSGCLVTGVSSLNFTSTVSNFNRMQKRSGRLRFLPKANFHGSVQVNVTVNDLGSKAGAKASKIESRALAVIVEPTVDKPRLEFLCPDEQPFISYGHTCLEVRECVKLSAMEDDEDKEATMLLLVTASDPGVSISVSDRSPVRVWNDGGPSIRVSGFYKNIRETLRTLYIHPPATLFGTAYDPDIFNFDVFIEVVTFGQLFNEPLPHDLSPYPTDTTEFSVTYRRVNRAPNIFVHTSHFSSSQLNPTLLLPGISVADPDARDDAMFEVKLTVDPDTAGGALSFAGVQHVSITKNMTLTSLNRYLQDLTFVFQDELWFGVTGITLEVSDLGNRGWVVDAFHDMYHGDTKPQVLSLRGGTATFVPEDPERYFAMFSSDITWEAHCKRHEPHSSQTSPLETMFRNYEDVTNSTNGSHPLLAMTIDADGYLSVVVHSDLGHELGGVGRTQLNVSKWYHLAVVVQRLHHGTSFGARFDSTVGEVALYVDGELDTAWPIVAAGPQRAHYGPVQNAFAIAGGSSGGLAVSRARVWRRALQPGELGRCYDPLSPVGGGPEGVGEMRPGADGKDEHGLAFSFSLDGSLVEARQRAWAKPTGVWSFVVDSPPRCAGLTESPYDNAFEQCATYDRTIRPSLANTSGLVPYFWHSPQAYAGMTEGMEPYANNQVSSFYGRGLHASMFFAVYRSFVNEAPKIHILEPAGGMVQTLEDNPTYVSLQVTHKATDQLVGRPLIGTLRVEHGFVRTISAAAVVRMEFDRRQIEYRAPIYDLNDFLAQIEYVPDPNYVGDDELLFEVTDLEFVVNVTLPISIAPLSDPLTLVCPPAVDMLEGEKDVFIGSNISIYDNDQLPGHSDADVEVAAELFVGDGGLRLSVPASLARSPTLGTELYDSTGAVNDDFIASAGWGELANEASDLAPTIRFNSTLKELRAFLNAVTFTASPELFHGVVHFGLGATVLATGEEASCSIGLVVHPVNTPPVIDIDKAQFLACGGVSAGSNGGVLVNADQDVLIAGVIKLSDPDEEDFSDWFTRRTHSARLVLVVSCGSLSFDLYGDSDYVLGIQNGSIAGAEGLTFHRGDGYKDAHLDVTSTLDHLNGQLHRLYYHSYGCADQDVTLSVELDDLGNYGAGAALRVYSTVTFKVLP